VVVFSGIQGYFNAILDEYERVSRLLIDSTRPRHKTCIENARSPQILVHIRYGDFAASGDTANPVVHEGYHLRQPISWFRHIIGEVRRGLGACVPVGVFSDAADDEIKALLALPGVTRYSFGSSIADLLALSTAKFLVASGSTFSMWAGYLGRMPVIWPPGQRRQPLHGSRWEFESEVGMGSVPEEVMALARRQLLA
jgi:hypothetical protein